MKAPDPMPPAARATLATWLLDCPGAHLAWSYWWVSLVHLRPLEGQPPAIITAPGNGWELICMAQNPDGLPSPDDMLGTVRPLHPIDWAVQFGGVKSDEQAIRVGEAVVRLITTGYASPDSDFRRWWERSIPATAECMATGRHLPS